MIVVRSVLFHVWFVLICAVMFVAALPSLALPRRITLAAARLWADLVLFGLRLICGLGYEVRGRTYIPQDGALVAVKHFSTWETIAFLFLVRDPAIVLKHELMRIPFYGWYTQKMRMLPVDRDGGSRSLRTLLTAAAAAVAARRQLVIFPEGTRRSPGDPPAYKPGIAGLYTALSCPCVPVALNSGLFWRRRGLLRRPGTIVIEFLPPIPPGLPRATFSQTLEERIEAATDRLLVEGRGAP